MGPDQTVYRFGEPFPPSSSYVMRRAARCVRNTVLFRICGTRPAMNASPTETLQSCMSLQRSGVSHM